MSWWTDAREYVVPAAIGIGTGILTMNPVAGAAAGAAAYGAMSGNRRASELAGAQGAAANAQLDEQRRTRDIALGLAGPSPAELQSRQQLLELQSQVLGRTNRELEFLQRGLDIRSPGAAEAGQGLFSSVIMRQRQAQRAQLESTLRRRFGTGYETTSAGQAALSQFDQGTADVAVQAIPQFLQTAYGAVGQTTNLENILSSRQVGAVNATPLTPYAGAPFVAQAAAARAGMETSQSVMNLGAMFLASSLGGLGSKPGSSSEEPKSGGLPIIFGDQNAPRFGGTGTFLPQLQNQNPFNLGIGF